MFNQTNTKYLDFSLNGRHLHILPWGHGLRVHDSFFGKVNDWALDEKVKADQNFKVIYHHDSAEIVNGKTRAFVDSTGKITFYNDQNQKILEEYQRQRLFKSVPINDDQFVKEKLNDYSSALKLDGREFIPNHQGDYTVHVRFEANDNERIYGMGQYQQKQLNLKGCKLELAQRNSQASVPFYLSSLRYGFLWNNPGIGEVSFANNLTEWTSVDTTNVDYWICAESSPKEIIKAYTAVTGRAPKMPKFALGLWQSKLRYRTQDEVLKVAKKYHKLGIPLSVIVIDYFHWPNQGDYQFDSKYFTDPKQLVEELDKMGIKLMVSVWPNVDRKSKNYQEMLANGYLVSSDRGNGITMTFQGNTTFFDATNPDARRFFWNKLQQNYYQDGIHLFWLDEAEPEYSQYDFDNHRLYLGRNTQVGNIYPRCYAKAIFDGENESQQEDKISLIRSAWAGSQKYGSLVWSGDIDSSFRSLRYQYQIGLNMGMAGIPWWTSDIGGFHGGSEDDEDFKELLIRWFEFATFCPVMRMHGDREPHSYPVANTGGGKEGSGAGNEIWSFGDDVYQILKKFISIREELKSYLNDCMNQAHDYGYPVMRSLFFDFPEDDEAWKVEDEHMLGEKYLVAPIFNKGQRSRRVYLPAGSRWKNLNSNTIRMGGVWLTVKAPLDEIPIFEKVD